MTVRQFFLHRDDETDPALAAVATDGETVRVLYSERMLAGHSQRDEFLDGMTKSFEMKLARDDLDDPVDRLKMNLIHFLGEVTEYDTYDDAEAAAREALNVDD